MIRTEKRIRICVALLICNLVFIWGNSLLPGEVSGRFSDWVKEILSLFLPGLGMERSGGGLLSKLAHFTEFAALGALLSWLFGMLDKQKAYALVCGAAAACIDETIQLFVPDRGPAVKDVLIDCSGVMTGMILLLLGYTWIRKKLSNNHLEEIQQ